MEQVRRIAVGILVALVGCARHQDGPASESFRQGDITVAHVVAPAPLSGTMSVYFTVTNAATTPDTLTEISTAAARTAMAHDQVTQAGMTRMAMLPRVVVPPGRSVAFAPGGKHVMLEGMARTMVPGDTVPLTLSFARAGRVEIRAPVVPYAQLDSALRR